MNKQLFRIPLMLLLSACLLTACNDDDAEPANDEELITTVRLTLTPTSGGNSITARWRDLDGAGGTAPQIDNLALVRNTTYNATIEVLNESKTPAEDITEEIEEEDEEHQFFYQVSSGLGLSVSYDDEDDDSRPVGLQTRFVVAPTTSAGTTGTLRITLRHELNKSAAGVANGDITNAGGETDIEITFPVTIQ